MSTEEEFNDSGVGFREAIEALAARPQCEHNLNGPCTECGPSLNLEEALAWQREVRGVLAPEGYNDR